MVAALAGVAVVVGVLATRSFLYRARTARARRVAIDRLTSDTPRARVLVARDLRGLWREPPRWLVAQLTELEIPVDVDDVWRWWRISSLALCAGGWGLGGAALALIAVAGAVGAPVVAVAVLRSRALASYDSDLALLLDAIGRGMRSGGSITTAIGEARVAVRGAVGVDAGRVVAGVERGQPIIRALDDWVGFRPRPSVRLAVGALALAVDTGGPPARVIEEVATALRQRRQLEGEAAALAAQARLSALVVGLAPIVFALLTCVTDRRNAHMLFGTPLGIGCVLVGLTLDAVGALWMHRISESVTR